MGSGMISNSFGMKWDLGTDTITTSITFIFSVLCSMGSGIISHSFEMKWDLGTDIITIATSLSLLYLVYYIAWILGWFLIVLKWNET